ncbi:MAG: class II glutamine amidotransferase [Chitinophagales bacterium]|nr:class II glutamine amidotransferase [Bacteroidota bacterium]
MCRWLAYSGAPILMGDLIHKPKNNLIHQSLHAQSVRVPTNGDGCGIGWYDNFATPGLYRSIHPAWNDMNLLDLADHIESPLFMSHVRATSLASVQETNCHPFRYNNWLFLHNGQIADFKKLHQPLIAKIAPEYFKNILGTTDSEVMFHLALTYGMEKDVIGGIKKMVEVVEQTAKENGIEDAIWMTLCISNGKSLWAFRYGSDGKSPTLYISPGIDELIKINPAIDGKFGDFAACIVSEPIGNFQDIWQTVSENSVVTVENKKISVVDFIK